MTRDKELELYDRIAKLEEINKQYKLMLQCCLPAIAYAYEDHQDQYYMNVKEAIEKTLKLGEEK